MVLRRERRVPTLHSSIHPPYFFFSFSFSFSFCFTTFFAFELLFSFLNFGRNRSQFSFFKAGSYVPRFRRFYLRQFSLDHQRLDRVDRVDVLHAVDDDSTHRFQALVASHHRDRVPLHQHVAVREQLDCFQGGAFGAHEALPTLDETVFRGYVAADFDDVALHVVVQDFNGLVEGNAAREELDQIARFQNDVTTRELSRKSGRVLCFARRLDRHRTFNAVQLAVDSVFLQLGPILEFAHRVLS